MIASCRALIWKEACEARWALYAGGVALIALPMLVTAAMYHRWTGEYSIAPAFADTTVMVGGAYAVIAGILVASRDFRDGERAAWRALPIQPRRFAFIKFVVGLATVLGVVYTAQVFHLLVASYVSYETDMLGTNSHNYALRGAIQQMTTHAFLLAALYAVTFAITAATRHVMTAIFLSAIAAALLYFLPLLVPTLAWANIWTLLSRPAMWVFTSRESVRWFADSFHLHLPGTSWWIVLPNTLPVFVSVMLFITAVSTGAAMAIVRRNVELRLHGQRVAWVMVLTGLGLFAVACMQIGSNLKPAAVMPLTSEPGTFIIDLRGDGERGAAVAIHTGHPRGFKSAPPVLHRMDPASFTLADGSTHAIASNTHTRSTHEYLRQLWTWTSAHPALAYCLPFVRDDEAVELCVLDLNALDDSAVIHRQDLRPHAGGKKVYAQSIHLMDGKLYVALHLARSPTQVIVRYDLADPRSPAFEAAYDVPMMDNYFNPNPNSSSIYPPVIEGLTWEQRFELRERLAMRYGAPIIVTPQRIVRYESDAGGTLHVFTTVNRTENHVEYQITSRRRATPLEAMMRYHFTAWLLNGDLLYLIESEGGMVVFNVADPTDAKKVGHYIPAQDQLQCLITMRDGRVAAVGRAMHVFDLR